MVPVVQHGGVAYSRGVVHTGRWVEDYLNGMMPLEDWTGASRLYAVVRTRLRAGLERVAAIPRTDPFWDGTNGEPSLSKVAAFHRARVRADPSDVTARWVCFAFAVNYCENDFGSPFLEPLIGTDPEALPMLVAAARWVLASGGFDTSTILRTCLQRLRDRDPHFDAAVARLRGSADEWTREMGAEIVRVLAGPAPGAGP